MSSPQPKSGQWVARPAVREHPELRLFCFPYAGGTTDRFSSWSSAIDPTIELALVQLPGRAGRFREPHITCMESMVDRLSEALKPYFDLPFSFFGHSMGALIAYELAQLLEGSRRGPERVFASGCPAPQRLKPDRCVGAMEDAELTGFLTAMGGTPPNVLQNPELLQLVLPSIRSDFRLVEGYGFRPRPPLRTPLSLAFGSEDPETKPEDIILWGELSSGGCETRWFEGNHFFLHAQSRQVAEWISVTTLTQIRLSMPYKES